MRHLNRYRFKKLSLKQFSFEISVCSGVSPQTTQLSICKHGDVNQMNSGHSCPPPLTLILLKKTGAVSVGMPKQKADRSEINDCEILPVRIRPRAA
jgi:hypothetical protein